MRSLALALALALIAALPARAQDAGEPLAATAPLRERLVSELSQSSVPINATFTGSEILVFGAVERNRFLRDRDTPPDIIVTITGPAQAALVRRKERVGGIWMNVEEIRVAAAPSFYAIASTRPIEAILRPIPKAAERVALEDAVYIAGSPTSAADPALFQKALIRIREDNGLYRDLSYDVNFSGGTLFHTRIPLPPNIVEGNYEARVLLARDGRVVDRANRAIAVQKAGMERFVFNLSREHPLLYGIFAVFAALGVGWIASEFFRWLRR